MSISGYKSYLPSKSPYLILKKDELGSRDFISFCEVHENLKTNIHIHSTQQTKINAINNKFN